MAIKEPTPPQGLSLEALAALADGSLLKELQTLSSEILGGLQSASATMNSLQSGNRQEMLRAIHEVAAITGSDTDADPSALKALEAIAGTELPEEAMHTDGVSTAALGGLVGLIERHGGETEALARRRKHRDSAIAIINAFEKQIEPEGYMKPNKKVAAYDYGKKTGDQFEARGAMGEHSQYSFVDVAPGLEIAIRWGGYVRWEEAVGRNKELFEHESNINTNRGTIYRLVARSKGNEDAYVAIASGKDKDGIDVMIYAPTDVHDINGNVHLAESYDEEVLEVLLAVTDGYRDMLKIPRRAS